MDYCTVDSALMWLQNLATFKNLKTRFSVKKSKIWQTMTNETLWEMETAQENVVICHYPILLLSGMGYQYGGLDVWLTTWE